MRTFVACVSRSGRISVWFSLLVSFVLLVALIAGRVHEGVKSVSDPALTRVVDYMFDNPQCNPVLRLTPAQAGERLNALTVEVFSHPEMVTMDIAVNAVPRNDPRFHHLWDERNQLFERLAVKVLEEQGWPLTYAETKALADQEP